MNYREFNDYEILYLVEENNEDAYSCMYEKYSPLISKYANFYYKNFKHIGVEYDDLYQEGMFGLSEAIRQYRKSKDSLFYTMALICVKREMQRLLVKANRYKNLFNSTTISLNEGLYDSKLTMEGVIYNITDITELKYLNNSIEKSIVDTKYNLEDVHSFVYELKNNGFSNVEISKLLDIPYKKVDNSLRYIKNFLSKNNIE